MNQDIIEILKELAATTSRNEKEAILLRNFKNDDLWKILQYTYDPYRVYGIGSKSFGKKYQIKQESAFVDIFELLEYLLKHPNGSDQTKILLNGYINNQPEEHREWIKRVVLKDLKVGVTAKTINKIWKGLIPTFDVMLAEPFERLFKRVGWQFKIDGVRATAIKRGGDTKLFTRKGKLIEGFDEVVKQLNALPINNVVFDGELIGTDYTDTMTKVFRKTKDKNADYMLFDILPLKEFEHGISIATFEERVEFLDKFYYEYAANNPLFDKIHLLETYFIDDPTAEQIDELCGQAVSLGYEGIMIKNAKGQYQCKRSFDWQKAKEFYTSDFEIIGFAEGQGQLKGTLGKVIVDVDGVQVGVGSGFSMEQRDEIWNNQNEYLGLYIEVRYQEVIKKSGSIRFGTVKSIRYDK